MPIPDFSKVWASNTPLTPYTFSDADYLTGWDFVGSAPPTKNEFDAWFKMVDEKLNWLYNQLQSTAAQIYPVGSVYISFDATNPSSLFGGTWTRLKDRMLMASGDVYSPGSTGGSASVTLTTSQIPSHTHSISTNGSHTHTATNASAGSHSHTVTGSNASAGSHTHTWSGSSASAGSHNHTITASTASAGNHTHTRGTMEITGQLSSSIKYGQIHSYAVTDTMSGSGALGVSTSGLTNVDWDGFASGGHSYDITFKASDGWTGATSSNGAHTHTVTASSASAGSHTHTISGTNANAGSHTHTWSGSVASAGSHTHTITVASNGSHTHTIGNTGGGLPVNTLPPYMTVYMWRRTA